MKKERFVAFFDAVMAIINTQGYGLVLGMLVWPPIVIISVFVAMICLVVEFSLIHKKHNG